MTKCKAPDELLIYCSFIWSTEQFRRYFQKSAVWTQEVENDLLLCGFSWRVANDSGALPPPTDVECRSRYLPNLNLIYKKRRKSVCIQLRVFICRKLSLEITLFILIALFKGAIFSVHSLTFLYFVFHGLNYCYSSLYFIYIVSYSILNFKCVTDFDLFCSVPSSGEYEDVQVSPNSIYSKILQSTLLVFIYKIWCLVPLGNRVIFLPKPFGLFF